MNISYRPVEGEIRVAPRLRKTMLAGDTAYVLTGFRIFPVSRMAFTSAAA